MKDKIKFLPLLLLYVVTISVAFTNTYKGGEGFGGDEGRYVTYAVNLSRGYYSPQDEIKLWSGPGYPIALLPLIPFKLLYMPAFPPRLLNALFLFMAILYFYYTLRLYMQERFALFFSYLLGIYPPFFRLIHNLLSEYLAIFLVCGFLFHFCKLHHDNKNSWVQLLIASVYLGYLALTKILFGYVILIGLLLFLSLYLWKKRNAFKKTLLVYFFALLCCLPYLFYTYSLTGKIFYWGSSGGPSLYFMSTPYKYEYGDSSIYTSKNHQEFFKGLSKLSIIQRDDELKKRAIYNITHHPLKFFKNWMANVGRLLFNYPYSYTLQRPGTYFYFIPNMFLVVFFILCLYPAYVGRRLIPYEIYFLVLFGLIAFGGHSLGNGMNRYFMPLVPVFLLWIIFTLMRIVKVEIRQ